MNTSFLTRVSATLAFGALLAGCTATRAPDARDPWEGFNRSIYSFNDSVDTVILRPVARAYTTVTPTPVRDCIHNIFSNLGDVWSSANSFLQNRPRDGINSFGRFMFNTTVGIGGCIDVASANGARKIPNDFGATLGVWGIGSGPYLVLPLLGSSTVRDGVGLIADFKGNPLAISQIDNVPLRNSLWGLQIIDTRASLLQATDTINRVALDPYSFIRDAYLQRRAAQVMGQPVDGKSSLPDYGEDPGQTSEPAMPAVQQNTTSGGSAK
jgi:phospholipid-binding lipoprotein MlaA